MVAEILEEYERRTVEGSVDLEPPVLVNHEVAKVEQEARGAVGGKLLSQTASGRLRTGPPPVYKDAIPSPKHSPLRTRSNRMNRANNVPKKT